MNQFIYLDHAATTPLSQHTKEYLISILDLYGNPSSLHSVGEQAASILSEARQSVADFIHSDTDNVYFTCSGSASNTLGIKGYYTKHNCCILYSPTLHKSALHCIANYPNHVPLKVHHDGTLDVSHLEKCLTACAETPFAVIEYANSEIGTIQNVQKIINLVHSYHGIVYLDCTGSIPTIPLDVKQTDIDMCGFSAHKLNALKGCGVFYKKPVITLEPIIYGNQEQGLMGGTENILGIASLGKAITHYDYASISSKCRDYVYEYVMKHIPDCYLVGSQKNRLAHNLYLCFQGVEGESLMMLLDRHGIQVSTGSACNSGNLSASPTLSAIGMSKEDAHSCIRITFSGKETKEDLDYFCHALETCVTLLRNLLAFV